MSISMFKGMQDILQKIGQKGADVAMESNMYEILTAPELLAEEGRTRILEEFPHLIGVSSQDYHALYLKTIYNVAEFLQNLPETRVSYYASKGGLLNHALDRTYRSLVLTRTYLLSTTSTLTEVTGQQALWIYAIFTTSLLLDVGKVAIKQIIELCDYKGEIIKPWLPFEGSMLANPPATHYKFYFEKENRERLRLLATPLLARQLMPAAGFNWIASDKDVLEAWLAILVDDQSGGGLLAQVIPLVDAQLLEWQIVGPPAAASEEAPKPDEAQEIPLPDLTPELPDMQSPDARRSYSGQPLVAGTGLPTIATASTATVLGSVQLATMATTLPAGEAFLKWLKKNIANNKIVINAPNASVHRVPEGLLILPKAFADFSKSNKTFKDPHVVAQQFALLELTGKERIFRHYAENADSRIIKNGMVINNIFTILPESVKLPSISEHISPLLNAVIQIPKVMLTAIENVQPKTSASASPLPPESKLK